MPHLPRTLALLYLCQCLVSAAVAPDSLEPAASVGTKARRQRPRAETGANLTERAPTVSAEQNGEGEMSAMLQRIHDRLLVLQALDDQQVRRLETLEYKITKLEVQNQEKMDGLRTDLREVSRRMQQVDWSVSKMETNVEAVKLDTSGLRQGQDTLRGLHAYNPQPTDEGSQGKLHMITTSLFGIRGTLATLQRDVHGIAGNVTKLDNVTRSVTSLRGHLVTKQHFTAALLDLRRQSARPVAPSQCPRPPSDQTLPDDCAAVQTSGLNRSGIYRIDPPGASAPFYVQCRLEERGGGWTVLQNRNEGAVDFYRGWQGFKHGFGNLAGEFWLGLEKMHLLTNSKVNELLIELEDFNEQTAYAYYSAFAVGSEIEGYPITLLGNYDGDAGDCLSYHAGHKFSTHDLDHDAWPDGNCAEAHTGGWWYNGCDNSNLNGRYLNGDLPSQYEYQGMYWYDWHGPHYSLKGSRISVRPFRDDPQLGEKAVVAAKGKAAARKDARRRDETKNRTATEKAGKMKEVDRDGREGREEREEREGRNRPTESPDIVAEYSDDYN